MINRDDPVVVVIEPPADLAECPICLEEKPLKEWIKPSRRQPARDHLCCQDCRNDYIKEFVQEGHHVDLPCFMPNCDEKLPSDRVWEELRRFQPQLLQSYDDKLLRNYLLTTRDVIWCPGLDCQYAEVHTHAERCPTLECRAEGCNTLICPRCKGKTHEGVDCLPPLQLEGVKSCPNCGVQIERIEGCRFMTCSICNQHFCWTCGLPGLNHRHGLLLNWPTHPCLKWPLHLALIVTSFLVGFVVGLVMGLAMFPMCIFNGMQQPPHICLRVLMSIATFIGFPIVGVVMAIIFCCNTAFNYQFTREWIEDGLIAIRPDLEVRLAVARMNAMNTET